MKTYDFFNLLKVTIFSIVTFGCNKADEFKPWLKGDIMGMVYTFDQFGTEYSEHSGVMITTQGIDKIYTAKSNEQGMFVLKDLPNGTYDIILGKEGFGTLKYIGAQHFGGKPTVIPGGADITSLVRYFYLYQIPTIGVTSVEIKNDIIKATLPPTLSFHPKEISFKAYFSSRPGFDIQDADISIDYVLQYKNGNYSHMASDYRSDGKYYADYYSPGDTVYFKVRLFTRVAGGIDKYYDYELKKWIYPNISNASSVFSFVL